MVSAAEAEYRGLYINTKEVVPLIIKLEELGHKQEPVPLKLITIQQKESYLEP